MNSFETRRQDKDSDQKPRLVQFQVVEYADKMHLDQLSTDVSDTLPHIVRHMFHPRVVAASLYARGLDPLIVRKPRSSPIGRLRAF